MSPHVGCQSPAEPRPALGLNTYADIRLQRLSVVVVLYIRASHSQFLYSSHLPIQSTYPSSLCWGNSSVSGLIHPSQVRLPVVGMDREAFDGTVRYWLEPFKSAALSPFGRSPEAGESP